MSVPSFQEVRLEIVRPGSPHNQLLSPLTPYMALCGEGSPITFHVELEHYQLLTRLERLRYFVPVGGRSLEIPPGQRQAEVAELGAEVAHILGAIPTLSTALARAQASELAGGRETIAHLRLVFSGSELSLIPFELAVAPLGYPGEGLEFSLQASLPIVVTREVRRDGQAPPSWDQSSTTRLKVLFVYAEPEGMRVPAKEHLRALRAALEPWIRRIPQPERLGDESDERARLSFVKRRLRVLPDASVEGIYALCAAERFTHVHILAHGDMYDHAGEKRFGVALCSPDGSGRREVVSGKRLAKALQAENAIGGCRSEPLVVTLATCDSGNAKTVLIPGGSIAHDLHSEGVPWVFASQFPLTVDGSVRMAEHLYPRIFRGDDPRQVLFELRRLLFRSASRDHDWASLVAYTTVSPNFAAQVAGFGSHQVKEAINVSLDYADSITARSEDTISSPMSGPLPPELRKEIDGVIQEVKEWLRIWDARKPSGNSPEDRLRRADVVGMHGSTYKRLALLRERFDRDDPEAARYYRESLESYRRTMDEAAAANATYYWSATQYLSLRAVKDRGAEPDIYALARSLVMRDITAPDDGVKAWAYATLAELELLAPYHLKIPDGYEDPDRRESVEGHCREIAALKGPNSFYVASTYRQFQRYKEKWPDEGWTPLADSALAAFKAAGADETRFEFPNS